MFVEDLARLHEESPGFAVGWLDAKHCFEKGATPDTFRRKLRRLSSRPVRKTRGFHLCPFCQGEPACGNGEIEVRAASGNVFVCPVLIVHYVEAHNYKPPESFVRAVEDWAVGAIGPGVIDLPSAVIELADDPTMENKDSFHRSFVVGRVGVRVPSDLVPGPSRAFVTKKPMSLPIAAGMSKDSEHMIVFLAGLDELARSKEGTVYVEFSGIDALNIAKEQNAGIVVQVSHGGRRAWAGISREELTRLRKTVAEGSR